FGNRPGGGVLERGVAQRGGLRQRGVGDAGGLRGLQRRGDQQGEGGGKDGRAHWRAPQTESPESRPGAFGGTVPEVISSANRGSRAAAGCLPTARRARPAPLPASCAAG